MNLKLFDEFMGKRRMPSQNYPEWLMFLEVCEIHLKKHKIEKPIVVELGSSRNRQKKFYEQLLGAEHIGIDMYIERFPPDILGDSHDPRTLKALKKKLNGRPINILFIDAAHSYKDVKKDYEMYSPLCSDIVALHDVETARYRLHSRREVWKFWDELKARSFNDSERGELERFLFLLIHQHRTNGKKWWMGIGMIIKG